MQNELRAYGLVKNTTHVDQCVGCYRILPGSIGRLPIEIVESMRKAPTPGLAIVEDHPDLVPFFRTDVRPMGPRYAK
jgi:hypothetical protein